jgi:hypothetical protein
MGRGEEGAHGVYDFLLFAGRRLLGYRGISLNNKDNERERRDRKDGTCASYQNNLLDGASDYYLRPY